MTRHSWIRTFVIGAALFTLALGGCGGGGGGGGAPPGTLGAGGYAYLALSHDTASGDVLSEFGLMDSDGQGTLTVSMEVVVGAGSMSLPANSGGAGVATMADGNLRIVGLIDSPLEGPSSGDGSLALVSTRPPNQPGMAIVMRWTSAPPLADLAGSWTRMTYRRMPAPDHLRSAYSEVTISPTGLMTINPITYTYNLDGAIDPAPIVLLSEQINRQGGGWLSVTIPPTADIERWGAVSADRNLIVLVGSPNGADLAAVTVLVRQGLATTTSALSGNHHACLFSNNLGADLNAWGSFALDGAGTGTWAYRINSAGGLVEPLPLSTGYVVNPDGTVDMGPSGGTPTWHGGAGPGGRSAALAGTFTTGGDPLLVFLIR